MLLILPVGMFTAPHLAAAVLSPPTYTSPQTGIDEVSASIGATSCRPLLCSFLAEMLIRNLTS